MQLVQNFPFFSIMLSMACAVICILLQQRTAKILTLFCLTILTVLSAGILIFTLRTGLSFSFMMGHFPAPFGNEIIAGPFEAFMALLFSSVTLLSIAGGLRDIIHDEPEKKINLFYFLINMLICAMLTLIYTNDIFTAYVFIEIITIAACSLISAKPGGRTLVATISYLILSLIGSSLMLFSIAILYGVTGHLLFPGIQQSVELLAATGQFTMPLFVLAGMLTAGLAIKSALFPFHGWLPDAHTSATTASSAILSGLIIKCYPILLIRIVVSIFSLETMGTLYVPHLLLLFGAAGIFFGSWRAIRQQNIKRMLAYASVSNIGIIFVAIGLNTAAGMAAAAFHIAAHAVGKALLFTAAGGLANVSNHKKDFNSLYGAGRRDLLAGIAFTVGALSMIGIPLFPGFISKFIVSLAALETPYALLVIPTVVVVSSLFAGIYYIKAIVCIFSKRSEVPAQTEAIVLEPEPLSLSVPYWISMAGLIALTLFLGLFSQYVIHAIELGLAAMG
jgi:multicomponent Na+:H+ antiporter subunit D